MSRPNLEMPHGATGEQIQLLQAIKQGQDENDVEISLVLNALNKGVAGLVAKNGKVITRLQGDLLQQLNQRLVDNDNTIDGVSTAVLSWTQNELNDAHMLLTQLAASAGLTGPGDPLEAALIDKLAAAPDIAYSATLLLALRDAMPLLERIAASCEKVSEYLGLASLPVAETIIGNTAPTAAGQVTPVDKMILSPIEPPIDVV